MLTSFAWSCSCRVTLATRAGAEGVRLEQEESAQEMQQKETARRTLMESKMATGESIERLGDSTLEWGTQMEGSDTVRQASASYTLCLRAKRQNLRILAVLHHIYIVQLV